jgi:hypothetical protein
MGINWSLDLFGEKKKKNGLGKSVYLHFGIRGRLFMWWRLCLKQNVRAKYLVKKKSLITVHGPYYFLCLQRRIGRSSERLLSHTSRLFP